MEREPLILLDTHVWIWWTDNPVRLSARARGAIEDAADVGVSPISCWEFAMLTTKGRMRLDRDVLDWIRQALARPRVRLLELTPEIAVAAARIADYHGDPADRIIVATALYHRVPIITKDSAIRSFERVGSIW